MPYKLSKRSLRKLVGVNERLQEVVHQAILGTAVDFGVIEGVRTLERQKQLVESGASKTMNSKHLKGRAVDLMAYLNGRASWELNLYDDLADAMKLAAKTQGVSLTWGGAWHISDIRKWEGTMQEAMEQYIDLRRSQGRRPFIDGPHFELVG